MLYLPFSYQTAQFNLAVLTHLSSPSAVEMAATKPFFISSSLCGRGSTKRSPMTFPSPYVHKILFTGYGRTPLILMLVILTANYQDQLGLLGKNKRDTEKFPEFLQKNNLKCL
jgi:hypothetical protein